MEKAKVKKISNIIVNILMYIFLSICILSVFFTVTARSGSDGTATVLGYQMRIVTSDSMAECEHTDVSQYEIKDIPIRSMIFVKVIPEDAAEVDEFYRSLEVGDVLTFRYVYNKQVTITHRITSIEENERGGYTIKLAGDNKNSDSDQLEQEIDTSTPNNMNYVIGKVTGQSYLFGLVMSVITSTLGIVLIIIVPCAIIILLEVVKIVRMLTLDKKKREQEKMQGEIDILRQKLAELEKEKNGDSTEAKED